MNLNNTHTSKKTTIPEIHHFDDLLGSEIDFKPLNNGLGFHHNKEELEQFNKAKRNNQIQARTIETVKKESFVSPYLTEKKQPTLMQSELSAFYTRDQKQSLDLEGIQTTNNQIHEATLSQRTTAFLIDLVILFAITVFTLAMIDAFADLHFITSIKALNIDYIIPASVMFCMYFVMYFTITDKAHMGSFGNSVIELSVVNKDNTTPTLVTLFVRNLICLLSFLSLGLFALIDLPSKITSTKVIKN